MAVMHSITHALLARAQQPPEPIGDGPPLSVTLQDRGPLLLGTCISLMVIMVIVIITRVYCRAYLVKKMGADDWCMILSAIFALGLVIGSCLGVRSGYGRHQWAVPWQESVKNQIIGYGNQIFYFLSLGFCKASLLLFIIRLRPSRRMVVLCWCILAFCTAFTFSAFVSSCLQCFPVSYLWNQLNPEFSEGMKHHCVNQRALQFALPSINILSDLVVWLLPIKMVWKVQLPVRQKRSLIAVFALGGLGVLAGVLRLCNVGKAVGSADASWDYLDLIIWSNAEVLISIIFGSAPAVKPFFSRYLPSLLGSSSFRSRSLSNNQPFPSRTNTKPKHSRSRGVQNGYALGSISGGISRAENSSTEEFRVNRGNITTRIEAPSMEDGESDEYRARDLADVIVKSTDVQVLVEERV